MNKFFQCVIDKNLFAALIIAKKNAEVIDIQKAKKTINNITQYGSVKDFWY
ncbi:hypothetical protein GXM_05428 [Nostoc sphaeroides CCNUC1]|uniref:Uncharacterized protein n=1 Tax=Nostoc sphaeroides CCNUC1 TaxID=2653204 RepID=A0A5P8W6Q8_9NOSO|nr:hypothetical protein GXM_05428 [Nostoc sphaeroides CCNUC1]